MPSPQPERLSPNNLTPATRTPWGGRKIVERYRSSDIPADTVAGEAWELSVDPERASRLCRNEQSLRDAILSSPVEWLGERIGQKMGMSSLQLKIIDAADNLSLQVHPPWQHPELEDAQSGKFETWVVLDALPHSGVYLGLRQGVSEADLRHAIEDGSRVHELLNFVPVQAGDIFHVDGGTPHAIGAGVLLLEPQAVEPNRCPTTYRFWDWQRRYNEHGSLDPNGESRPLAIERSLAMIRWSAPRGVHFVEQSRGEAETIIRFSGGKLEQLALNDWFRLERITGEGKLSLPPLDGFAAMLCLQGQVDVTSESGALTLDRGECAALPASCRRLDLQLSGDAEIYMLREREDWLLHYTRNLRA